MTTKINPYLNFNGNCEEAFHFYQAVFGGSFAMVMRFKEMPSEFPTTADDAERIMHMALPIGDSSVLMGSDVPSSVEQAVTDSNVQLSVSTASKEEADRLYNDLCAAGNATMPMADTFWGAYFGMLTDRFGVQWMINYDQNYQ